jgi:hypothetical protein
MIFTHQDLLVLKKKRWTGNKPEMPQAQLMKNLSAGSIA